MQAIFYLIAHMDDDIIIENFLAESFTINIGMLTPPFRVVLDSYLPDAGMTYALQCAI